MDCDIIYMNTRMDCDDFNGIINGVNGTILINPRKNSVRELIASNTDRPLIMFGHGDCNGLYNSEWNGYVVDGGMTNILRNRHTLIGIWCYASEFADQYGLSGFFTSMFISNKGEADYFGFTESTEDQIRNENIEFSRNLNELILNNNNLNEWVGILQSRANRDLGFVRYNYDALTFYD